MNSISAKIVTSDNGLSLSGDFVYSNIATLLKEAKPLLQQHLANEKAEQSFAIDCKGMTRIDSAGIALLLEWQRQFKNKKKDCSFKGLTKQAQALITAYRLQSIITA